MRKRLQALVGSAAAGAAAALCMDAAAARHAPPAVVVHSSPPAAAARPTARVPLFFEENLGQARDGVRFVCRSSGGRLALMDDGFAAGARGAGRACVTTFVGADPAARPRGERPLPGTSNVYIGDDAARWITGARHFSQVRWDGLWPGIDLVFRAGGDAPEYDFHVAEGADASRIRLRIGGGRIGDAGARILADGGVRHSKPRVFDAAGMQFPCRFAALDDGTFTVEYEGAAPGAAVVIDPVVDYASFFGGDGFEQHMRIAVDASGRVFLAGSAGGSAAADGLPAAFPPPLDLLPDDASNLFAARLTPDGSTVDWIAILGTGEDDEFGGLAPQGDGSLWICGSSRQGTDYPVAGSPYRSAAQGAGDGLLTRIAADGQSLAYSGYLGGGGTDKAHDIVADPAGGLLVCGQSFSRTTFAATAVTVPATASEPHGFVVRMDLALSGVAQAVWLAFAGGAGGDTEARSLALGSDRHAYVCGETESTAFEATPGAFQTADSPGLDAWVARYDLAGSRQWATLVGGAGDDGFDPTFGRFRRSRASIDVDAAGRAVVACYSDSPDFPTSEDALIPARPDERFGIAPVVFRLAADGSGLDWSTWFGLGNVEIADLIVHSGGHIFFCGTTGAPKGFPFAGSGPVATLKGANGGDMLLVEMTGDGSELVHVSTFGHRNTFDSAYGVAEGQALSVWVAGDTGGRTNKLSLASPADEVAFDLEGFVVHLPTDEGIANGGKLKVKAQPFKGPTATGTKRLGSVLVVNKSRDSRAAVTPQSVTGPFRIRSFTGDQTVIAPRGAARILLEFDASAAGKQSGTLTLASSDEARPQIEVTIRADAR